METGTRRTSMSTGVLRTGCIALAMAAQFVSAGCAAGDGGSSGASCVGPYLNDQPPTGPFRGPVPTVSPGHSLTIYGHWFTSTCNDTGDHAPLSALPPVRLSLHLPDGAVRRIGVFRAHGQDMGFSIRVSVPKGTPAGKATVQDDSASHRTFQFKVGR